MSLPSLVLRVEAFKSLRHILASPRYAPGTIAVNVMGGVASRRSGIELGIECLLVSRLRSSVGIS